VHQVTSRVFSEELPLWLLDVIATLPGRCWPGENAHDPTRGLLLLFSALVIGRLILVLLDRGELGSNFRLVYLPLAAGTLAIR